MMGHIFGQPSFLKGARFIVIGVITLKGFQDEYGRFHRSVAALLVVSV